MRVFSRDATHREAFAAERSSALGVPVVAASSAEAAVRDADVVVTITTSTEPVLSADWVKVPSLVIGAGSNFPNRTELPADLVTRAQTVVVDQLAVARLESGDLIQAVGAGALAWERVTELATVLAGVWKAPAQPGITLFEAHGLALWDLAAASVVLPKAIEQGLGEEIALF